jgi:Fe-Mn family superoxide dismutase
MLKRAFSQFTLPKLPFGATSLEPIYSAKTLDFHHGKHHQTYVNNLNNALDGRSIELEDIIENEAQNSMALRN